LVVASSSARVVDEDVDDVTDVEVKVEAVMARAELLQSKMMNRSWSGLCG
jgi:hypothetical protein